MSKFLTFVKKEPVLIISALCALVSMIFVPPNSAYGSYIDWKVLAMLFCLMSVVAGFQHCLFFDVLAQRLLHACSGARVLRLVLVLLPFVISMFITNDVALITFVPFAVSVLTLVGRQEELAFIITLQTIAANLGSMATPVGNPQSLFLYHHFQLSIGSYFSTLLPFAAISLVGIVLVTLVRKNVPIQVTFEWNVKLEQPKMLLLYGLLFVLCMLSVLHLLDYRVVLLVVILALMIFDRGLFKHVDYGLLLTFVCFFLFSGNLGSIPAVRELLAGLLEQNALLTSALASQVVSNVPAAVLLAGFTDNARGLLVGTNVGGLGTLIASLASLISFKYYLRAPGAKPLRYLGVFTAFNAVGLVLLLGAAALL